mmetsp:Transcript_34624/g.57290  ORF Transcript_34624/g.57290 Transcript_34624/m.57290 type:complete len:213 (-) Transcript_34624:731-1369(-)
MAIREILREARLLLCLQHAPSKEVALRLWLWDLMQSIGTSLCSLHHRLKPAMPTSVMGALLMSSSTSLHNIAQSSNKRSLAHLLLRHQHRRHHTYHLRHCLRRHRQFHPGLLCRHLLVLPLLKVHHFLSHRHTCHLRHCPRHHRQFHLSQLYRHLLVLPPCHQLPPSALPHHRRHPLQLHHRLQHLLRHHLRPMTRHPFRHHLRHPTIPPLP